jgi:iron(III) transport system permease protein
MTEETTMATDETVERRAGPAQATVPWPARRRPTAWTLVAWTVSVLIAAPIIAVVAQIAAPSGGVWTQLAETVLARYLVNSALLTMLVVALATLIGTATGWLVATTEFPGRRWFEWALLLPMAMPAYVVAYVYLDRLAYAGPIQTTLRETFGWGRGDYWFPRVATLEGAGVLMALVLYPYVYLLARAAFMGLPAQTMHSARVLGASPWSAFRRVALPMARPALAAGAAFVAMETLSDYGAVVHLGVETLTTGIFRTWFARGSPVAAAQLAAMLLVFVAAALYVERASRRGRRFDADRGGRSAPLARSRLRGWRATAATAACAAPILLGFVAPAVELARLAIIAGDPFWGPRFFDFARNSLLLAATTAAALVVIGGALAYGRRLDPSPTLAGALEVASVGYAVPGAVIAVGVLTPLSFLDNALDAWLRAHAGVSTGLLLTGSLFAILFAYAVRFLAISLRTIDAGLSRVPLSFDAAARSLGDGPTRVMTRVHVPLLRSSLLTAAIFVFVDVMKELPATLILRPFNFDTLAIRAHRLASDGRLEEAATSALIIVVVGVVPVILLSRAMRGRDG